MSDSKIEPDEGLYFVKFDGTYEKIIDERLFPIRTQGPSDDYFALQISSSFADYNPLVVINLNGSIIHLDTEIYSSFFPRLSSDEKYILIPSNMGVKLYSNEYQLLNIWDIKASEIIWRPDAQGAFLLTSKEIYYLSIPDGEPTQVNYCSLQYCTLRYTWLP